MATPTVTARVAPTGLMLENGYRVTMGFSLNPSIAFWEKTVDPPGYDGGDEIEITTQHNNDFETKAPRALLSVTNGKATVAWNPLMYTAAQARSLINKKGAITWWLPDGSSVSMWAYLKSWVPKTMENGKQPEADIEVVVTNKNPSTGAEEGPYEADVSGT